MLGRATRGGRSEFSGPLPDDFGFSGVERVLLGLIPLGAFVGVLSWAASLANFWFHLRFRVLRAGSASLGGP